MQPQMTTQAALDDNSSMLDFQQGAVLGCCLEHVLMRIISQTLLQCKTCTHGCLIVASLFTRGTNFCLNQLQLWQSKLDLQPI